MVKGYAARRRRYYRRRGWSFKRAISNYTYTKLSTIDEISMDNTGMKLIKANGVKQNLYGYLDACADWKTYTQLYTSYKLVGLAISVTPNTPIGTFKWGGTGAIAYTSFADQTDVSTCIESNKSVMLSVVAPVRRYFPLNNGATSWVSTSSPAMVPGSILVACNRYPTDGGLVWSVRFDFYVMFKNTV